MAAERLPPFLGLGSEPSPLPALLPLRRGISAFKPCQAGGSGWFPVDDATSPFSGLHVAALWPRQQEERETPSRINTSRGRAKEQSTQRVTRDKTTRCAVSSLEQEERERERAWAGPVSPRMSSLRLRKNKLIHKLCVSSLVLHFSRDAWTPTSPVCLHYFHDAPSRIPLRVHQDRKSQKGRSKCHVSHWEHNVTQSSLATIAS